MNVQAKPNIGGAQCLLPFECMALVLSGRGVRSAGRDQYTPGLDRRIWIGGRVSGQSADRHSDKEKFRSDLNHPESCEMSERLLKTLRKSGDFQAEYEGSIPFTRSNSYFNDLYCAGCPKSLLPR